MNYIWVLLISAVFTYLATYLVSYLAKKHSLYPKVRDRDVHSAPVPRIGGVAVIIGFVLTMILLVIIYGDKGLVDFGFPYKILGVSIDKRLLGILIATIILGVIMLIDDVKSLKPWTKLSGQILAGIVLALAGIGANYINNPFGNTIYLDAVKIPIALGSSIYHVVFWADLLLIAWVVILTNATNFIDGIDGLASSLSLIAGAIIIAISLKFSQPSMAILAAAFSGAIIGFLPLNLPPAKMFLGDSGSMFLGLMLAVLTVISGGKFATLLLVFGLVILDAVYVIFKRLIQGKNPFTSADQTHLHHRLIKAGFSKTWALLTIVFTSTLFGVLAVTLEGRVKLITIAVLALLSLVSFVILDLSTQTRKKKSEKIS